MGGQMMPTISISGFATQITTSKWFSMNTKTGIYIICTTRTTMQVVLDRARVSRLCRSLYGVRTHNTTRLCHMTSNNLSTRIFGTGFSFLSLSLSLSPLQSSVNFLSLVAPTRRANAFKISTSRYPPLLS